MARSISHAALASGVRGGGLRAVVAAISIACLATPSAAQRAQLSGESLRRAAEVLRLEDRREYDPQVFSVYTVQPPDALARRAVLAAGRIGDRQATPVLTGIATLGTDTSVAASAAFALGLLRDTSAVEALASLLKPEDVARRPTVIGEAALALGKMPTQRGKQAVEDFLSHAPASGPGVRRAVGEALLAWWRFPRPVNVNVAARWLASADPEIRWRAAYALSRRANPQASAALARAATDTDPLVRSFAMRGLTAVMADSSSSVGRAAALRLVLAATSDRDHAVSVNAVRTLGTYDASEAISRLIQLLTGGDAYLAITAAESLARLGAKAPAAAVPLRAVAMDAAKPIFLRTTALASLAEVDPPAAVPVADAFMRERGWRARAAAARIYANAAKGNFAASPLRPKLEAAVRDADGRIATAALESAIGAAGDSVARIRPLLLMGLESPDFYARVNAIGGLGQIADPADAPLLLDAYARAQRDSMDDAALAAVDALGALGKKDTGVARAFFARFPRSGDYLVRQHVAAAFGEDVPAGWGRPLPIMTGRAPESYRRLVASTVARPRPHARIVTDRGAIEVELFADDAPLTVENFLSLARRKFFDGQEWPRVVPNFVIQGGDPRGDTNGGPGYAIRDEINRHPYEAGTLGMALSGPDTGGSQWFVTHSPQPHLDGTYTVFGRVVRGMEVVGRILPGDRIIRVEEVR